MVKFVWSVAVSGYLWKERQLDENTVVEPDIGPVKGWPVRRYEPLKDHTGLFYTFAETEPTEEGIISFANRYGLLGLSIELRNSITMPLEEAEQYGDPVDVNRLRDPSEEYGAEMGGYRSEEVALWKAQITFMRQAMATWDRLRRGSAGEQEVRRLQDIVDKQLLGSVSPRLESVQRGGLELAVVPLTLRGVLWLQFAQAVSGNKEFRTCRTCREWFKVSPESARTNRQFCSEACRSRAYRGRKEQAQRLAAEGRSPKDIAAELGSDVKTVRGWIRRGKA
jgi:hypothetical protein